MDLFSKQSVKELLQCSICLGELLSPRALPCLHTFCHVCLEGHIRTSKENAKSKRFQCPTCRVTVPIRSVSDFPKDFRVTKLRDALNDNIRAIKVCELCSDSHNAEIYCVDCEKYLCMDCNAKHQIKPVFVSHITVCLHKERVANQSSCPDHSTEYIKFFCETCDTSVCVVCIFGVHRNHVVVDLNESFDSKREELRGCMMHMRSQISLLKDTMFQQTCIEGQLKGEYEDKTLQIRKHTHNILGIIHRQESQFLAHLDQHYQSQYDVIGQRKDRCRMYLQQFTKLQSRLESILRVNNMTEVLNSYKDILHDIKQIEISKDYNSSLLTTPTLPHFDMTDEISIGRIVDPKIAKSPQQLDRMCDDEKTTDDYFESSLQQPSVARGTPPIAKLLYHVGGYGKNTSQLCLPYGVVFTEDETLVVAENGNSRLQMFNKLGHTTKIITLMTCIPRCIIDITEGKFAVSDELEKCVKIIDIYNESVEKLACENLAFPYGLTRLPNKDIAVSDMIFENVTVISPKGVKLLNIGCRGNGNENFENPSYLATDLDGNIFISDSAHHEIKVFDSRGQFQFKFGGYGNGEGELKYPKGIAIDVNGMIYVADAGNDRVVVFSRLGFFLSTLLDKAYGIERPTGLAFHPVGLLAVSMPDKHEVSVYQLVDNVIPAFQKYCSIRASSINYLYH